MYLTTNTLLCYHKMAKLLQNLCNRHLDSLPMKARYGLCIISSMISVQPQLRQCCMQHHVMLDCVNSSLPSATYMRHSLNWVNIGSDSGLSLGRHQAII